MQSNRIVFRVWSADRTQRKSLASICSVQAVVEKASSPQYLNRRGTRLVLEQDGTEISDDEVLVHFSTKVLLLLCRQERWTASNDDDNNYGDPAPPYDSLGTDFPVKDQSLQRCNSKAAGSDEYATRALELFDRKEERDSRRVSNHRSLVMAAAGGVVMIGGAAAAVAAAPIVATVGAAAVVGGAAAELFGLAGFLKTA